MERLRCSVHVEGVAAQPVRPHITAAAAGRFADQQRHPCSASAQFQTLWPRLRGVLAQTSRETSTSSTFPPPPSTEPTRPATRGDGPTSPPPHRLLWTPTIQWPSLVCLALAAQPSGLYTS